MDAAIITLQEIPATLSWYHKLYQPPFLPPSTESNAVGCKAWHDIHAGRNSIPAHRDDTEAIVSEQPNGALLPQDPPRHIHRANLAPVLFSDNFRNDFPDTNLLEYIGTAKTIQPRLKMLYEYSVNIAVSLLVPGVAPTNRTMGQMRSTMALRRRRRIKVASRAAATPMAEYTPCKKA